MKKYLKYWYILVLIIIFVLIILSLPSKKNFEEVVNAEEVIIEKESNEEEIIKKIFVDIKGEVKKPGVYEINSNSRIIDVIKIAGGLTKNADTSIINLSKKVMDEMTIKIYSKKEIEKAYNLVEPKVVEVIKEVEKIVEKECNCKESICVSNNDNLIENEVVEEKSNNKININTATKDVLMTIPGIGESKAINIVEYRNNNKYNSIDDIKNVTGIGDSLFEKIKDYITV